MEQELIGAGFNLRSRVDAGHVIEAVADGYRTSRRRSRDTLGRDKSCYRNLIVLQRISVRKRSGGREGGCEGGGQKDEAQGGSSGRSHLSKGVRAPRQPLAASAPADIGHIRAETRLNLPQVSSNRR